MKVKYVPIILFLGALSVLLSSYQIGYTNSPLSGGDERSGATGVASCGGGGCHNNGATAAITVSLELDSAGVAVTSYRAGGSYTVKLTGTNTTNSSLPDFGFALSSVKSSGSGTVAAVQAGNWGTAPTGAQISVSGSGLLIAEHQVPVGPTTGTGGNGSTYARLLPWTAPVAGTGSVKFFGMVNVVNGNGNADNSDKWNNTTLTITEATGPNGINTVSDQVNSLKVYPTLMSGNANVSFDLKESADVTAQIISMNGQVVQTLMSGESLSTGNVNRSYDVAGLSAGVYFVRIQTGNSSVVSKIVKQ
ncbi:MAG: hypothetical protein JWO03_1666 [Bacteroidetes bacterium]|nr:hypothetical protein [Bacteroidota bacterium]